MKIRDWEKYKDNHNSKEKFRKKPKRNLEDIDKPRRKKRYKQK
tara:strand:- start:4196 stop:4324 length:129 start_codon:yes stop_codon:yes gene_type:complete